MLPVRGVIVTLLAERNQTDVNVRNAAWTAATALVNWFPYPHVELQVMGRLQFPSGTDVAKTLFAQAHYFFCRSAPQARCATIVFQVASRSAPGGRRADAREAKSHIPVSHSILQNAPAIEATLLARPSAYLVSP